MIRIYQRIPSQPWTIPLRPSIGGRHYQRQGPRLFRTLLHPLHFSPMQASTSSFFSTVPKEGSYSWLLASCFLLVLWLAAGWLSDMHRQSYLTKKWNDTTIMSCLSLQIYYSQWYLLSWRYMRNKRPAWKITKEILSERFQSFVGSAMKNRLTDCSAATGFLNEEWAWCDTSQVTQRLTTNL